MDTSVINLDMKLVVVYYDGGKNQFVQVWNIVRMYGFKDELDQINGRLNHKDMMVNDVEYRHPSVDSPESV